MLLLCRTAPHRHRLPAGCLLEQRPAFVQTRAHSSFALTNINLNGDWRSVYLLLRHSADGLRFSCGNQSVNQSTVITLTLKSGQFTAGLLQSFILHYPNHQSKSRKFSSPISEQTAVVSSFYLYSECTSLSLHFTPQFDVPSILQRAACIDVTCPSKRTSRLTKTKPQHAVEKGKNDAIMCSVSRHRD